MELKDKVLLAHLEIRYPDGGIEEVEAWSGPDEIVEKVYDSEIHNYVQLLQMVAQYCRSKLMSLPIYGPNPGEVLVLPGSGSCLCVIKVRMP